MTEFLILAVVVLFLAFFAERQNARIFFLASMFMLAFFSAIRGENVGIDTMFYYRLYQNVLDGKVVYGVEPSFVMFCSLCQMLSRKPEFLVFLLSFLTNVLVVSRLWSFRKECSFFTMVAIYIACYYPVSMNIMRQFFAVSLVFAGSYFLKGGKKWLYIPFLVLAVFFHRSALLGLLLLIVCFFSEKNIHLYKRVAFIVVFMVSLIVVVPYALDSIMIYFKYFDRESSKVGLLIPLKLFFFFLIVVVARIGLYKKDGYALGKEIINHQVTFVYFIGLLMTCYGVFFQFMDRIGLFFMVFEMPFWGRMAKSSQFPLVYRTIACSFAICLFIMYLIADGQKIFPYETILGSL